MRTKKAIKEDIEKTKRLMYQCQHVLLALEAELALYGTKKQKQIKSKLYDGLGEFIAENKQE